MRTFFWKRAGAFLIDGFLLQFAYLGIHVSSRFIFSDSVQLKINFFLPLVFWFCAILYFTLFDSRGGGGHSLGKYLFRLKVVAKKGTTIGIGRALLRSVITLAVFLPFFYYPPILALIYWFLAYGVTLLSVYFMAFFPSHQTVADFIVDSYVISMNSDSLATIFFKFKRVHIFFLIPLGLICFLAAFKQSGIGTEFSIPNSLRPGTSRSALSAPIMKKQVYYNSFIGTLTDIEISTAGQILLATNEVGVVIGKDFKEREIILLGKYTSLFSTIKQYLLEDSPLEVRIASVGDNYFYYTPFGFVTAFGKNSPLWISNKEGYMTWNSLSTFTYFKVQELAGGKFPEEDSPGFVMISGGILMECLTSRGRTLWQKQLEKYSTNPQILYPVKGMGSIIVSESLDSIEVIDTKTGKNIKSFPTQGTSISFYNSDGFIWPVRIDTGAVSTLDWEGQVSKVFPLQNVFPDYELAVIKQWEDKTAVLFNYKMFSRSLLILFDDIGREIYREVIEDDCASMNTAPSLLGETNLLLGCSGSLWAYYKKSEK